MTLREILDRLLSTDPTDSGCDVAMDLLHVYAELRLADPAAARAAYPAVAVHLAQCGPCAEDLNGLLAAVI
jgi:hypothetical protein